VQLDPLGSQLVNLSYAYADSALYPLYANGDLRKSIFFKAGTVANSKMYKTSYTKVTLPFAGIATDEIYLIKAECLARKGDASGAMSALNILLKARWATNSFIPIAANSPDDALIKTLLERRKELVMRGTRWTDLKRLNKDSRFKVTIYRKVNGVSYTLAPGDLRYTWPIPDDVINANPGMAQNP
jgi:hypothetical protein